MLNYLKLLKAGISYLIFLNFLTTYKFKSIIDKELIKKWKFIYYLSQNYKLLVLALTIKTKEKKFTPKPITLTPLLLPFKKIKDLNAKILYSLFLFKNKILKTKREDLKFNRSIFSKKLSLLLTPYKNIKLKFFFLNFLKRNKR